MSELGGGRGSTPRGATSRGARVHWLGTLSFRGRLALLVAGPLVALLVVFLRDGYRDYEAIVALRRLHQDVSYALLAVETAHELQRERGLDAFRHMSSDRAAELLAQHAETNVYLDRLGQASPASPIGIGAGGALRAELDALRKGVADSREASSSRFDAYTDVVERLLAVPARVADMAPDADAARSLRAFALLTQATEFRARERGLVGTKLAHASVDAQHMMRIAEVHAEHRVYVSRFLKSAHEDEQRAYAAILSSKEEGYLARVRERVHDGLIREEPGVTAMVWFDNASVVLERFRVLERQSAARVTADAERAVGARLASTGRDGVLGLLLVGAVLAFGAINARLLAREVGGDIAYARAVAQSIAGGQYEIDVRVEDSSADSLLVAIRNMVQKLRETLVQLEARQNELLGVLDSAGDGFALVEPDGSAGGMWSKAMEQWFGPRPDAGVPVCHVLFPNGGEDCEEVWLAFARKGCLEDWGAAVERLPDRLERDGRSLSIRYRPIVVDGALARVLIIVSDDVVRNAKASQKARETFLASVSHDLRSPLHAIVGTTEVLLWSATSSEQRQHLTTIRRACETLLALVNDILDYSKLDSARFDLTLAPFDARECLTSAVALVRAEADHKGVRILAAVEDDVPPPLIGDAVRVRQVLLNLLGNAVKFTNAGDIRASLTTTPICDTTYLVRFRVRDEGVGIAQDKLDAIFEPFVQAGTPTTPARQGIGLGLAICRQLAKLMGGTVSASSALGAGSTFEFSFPAPMASGDDAVLERAEVTPVASARPLGRRVLAVDDQEVNRTIVAAMLHRLGHAATVAGSGEEAIARLSLMHFDVVLLDLRMEGLDGLATARRIRERSPASFPWIVAVTANVSERDKAACLAAGMNDFLAKPFDIRGLAALLERCPSAPANAPALLYANSSDIRDVDESVLEGVWSLGVFKESVTTFFASAESTLRALERAISKDDVPTARSLAHRLHGSSGMIGARRVERAAAALEQLAESDSLSGATDLAAELEHTLGIARVAMLRSGERREVSADNGAGAESLPASAAEPEATVA